MKLGASCLLISIPRAINLLLAEKAVVIENSGHWIMEEQPQQAIRAIVAFIEKQ